MICITETFGSFLNNDLFFHLPGYFLLRQDRLTRGGGGIIIYVRNGLSYQLESSIAHTSGLWEAMICTIFSPSSTPLKIVCVYRSPGNMIQSSLEEFIDYFRNNSTLNMDFNTIIVGDFNFPQINWDLNLCNAPADSPAQLFLSTVVNSHLFQIVNSPTRFRAGQTPNILDLVLVHDELSIQSLESLPGIGKSDHVMLLITVQFFNELKFNPNTKFNFNKADFDLINSIINSINWQNEFHGLNCDDALEVLNCFLLTLCHSFIPQTKISPPKFNKAPWMSRDIKTLINRKKHSWDIYKLNPTESNLRNFKQNRNSLTAIIRKRKSEYESNLVSSCRSCPKKLFAYINAKKKTQPLACLKVGTKIINEDIHLAEALRDYFDSAFSDSPSYFPGFTHSCHDDDFVPFFSKSDVFKLLNDLNQNSSSGADGIHPALLKNCAASLSTPIYLIFCISLRSGVFPASWKDANVIPLHKGGIATSVENYRPISLLSATSKIFEKIIAKYINNQLSSTNFFHPSQHGFVKGKSCLTNLLTAVDYWTSALDHYNPCDVIYLDFKKAFDTVDHSNLLSKLQKLNLLSYLLYWFESYLSKRRFRVSVRGSFSSWSPVTSGVPQGSVLGPILFNIFINDLPPSLQHSFCILFADDLKLYRLIQSNADHILLQSDLNKIAQWASVNKISFNISKSAVLHLGSNNSKLSYDLNGTKLSPKDTIRD